MAASVKAVPGVMRQKPGIPWFYLMPTLIVMTVYIVYPGLRTIYLSFRNADDTGWAFEACRPGQPCWGIFENYRYALTSDVMKTSLLNNLIWIVLMVSATLLIGLLIATLADRVRYEVIAKSIIFLPMAISFVGAGVIWKFVYDYGSSQVQVGILNAMITALGGEPVAFLTVPLLNTICLIIVGIWIWTGFCMTILAAALKNVPEEILEAARIDGANEWAVFWKVMVPMIAPTITVVITTMTINVLKVFDIVYVMTGGNYGTDVIANRMYFEMYKNFQPGRGTAIAIVLVVLIVPVMIMNLRRFSEQEASR